MAAAVDVRQVASFASVPEDSVQETLTNPTAELVHSLLQGITAKIQEFDQLKTEKLRSDIEFESVVRSNESKINVLKKSVEKGLGDVSKLRTELQISGTACFKNDSRLSPNTCRKCPDKTRI